MANLQKIKDLADEKNMSVNAIAKRVGLTNQGLYKMIRNNSMQVDTLELVAAVLGVPAATFLDCGQALDVTVTTDGGKSPSAVYNEMLDAKERQISKYLTMLESRDRLAEQQAKQIDELVALVKSYHSRIQQLMNNEDGNNENQ